VLGCDQRQAVLIVALQRRILIRRSGLAEGELEDILCPFARPDFRIGIRHIGYYAIMVWPKYLFIDMTQFRQVITFVILIDDNLSMCCCTAK
jgi:hypothetical protein